MLGGDLQQFLLHYSHHNALSNRLESSTFSTLIYFAVIPCRFWLGWIVLFEMKLKIEWMIVRRLCAALNSSLRVEAKFFHDSYFLDCDSKHNFFLPVSDFC